MEWLFGVLASVAVAFMTAQLSLRAQRERMEMEQTDRLNHLREELKLEYSIETAIKQLLGKQGWEFREFKTIHNHFVGMEKNTLREHLVRAGATSFKDDNDVVKWGLLELNLKRLAKKD